MFDDVLNTASPPEPEKDKMAVLRKYVKDWLEPEKLQTEHIAYTSETKETQCLFDFEYFLEVYRAAFFFKKMHFQKTKSEYLKFRREFLV